MNIFERGEGKYNNLSKYVEEYPDIDDDTKNNMKNILMQYKFYLKYNEEEEVKKLIDEFFKNIDAIEYARKKFIRGLKGEESRVGDSCYCRNNDDGER